MKREEGQINNEKRSGRQTAKVRLGENMDKWKRIELEWRGREG